jgi:hypothetical protein
MNPAVKPTWPICAGRRPALGVAEAVQISTPTARIAQAYAASDLVLQLSDKPEAFGRTVVERCRSAARCWAGTMAASVNCCAAAAAGAVPLGDARHWVNARWPCWPAAVLPTRIPFTLQAMQRDTLRLYADLAG